MSGADATVRHCRTQGLGSVRDLAVDGAGDIVFVSVGYAWGLCAESGWS